MNTLDQQLFLLVLLLVLCSSGHLSSQQITATRNQHNQQFEVSSTNKPSQTLRGRLKVPKDEFNSTESIRFNIIEDESNNLAPNNKQQLSSLKNLLLRSNLNECCPKWKNLSQSLDIQDELKRRFNGASSKQHKTSPTLNLRGSDLMDELSLIFANITYLSIDGQPGDNERDKYYSFYDNVQYFLRLIKLAHNYLNEKVEHHNQMNASSGSTSFHHEIDFTRKFQRKLKSLEFKANQDPILSSFIQELTTTNNSSTTKETASNNNQSSSSLASSSSSTVGFIINTNPNFDYYEDFLANTQFGQYYAKNISMIRESVMVFDQICSHLMHIDLLGNLTRPSKQYELIRRMSFELYQIRSELIEQISLRVLSNRHDVQRIFARLNDFAETRPYIKMLGDEFSWEPPSHGENVRQLTRLLDLYLRNNMTQASFYNSLSELPEDFILLGSSIAHYYETKEVPYFSKFDADYFNNQNQINNLQQNSSNSGGQNQTGNKIPSKPTDARQSNLSLLTRLFN